MDLGHILVAVLLAAAGVFLALAERDSRQNEARSRAEAAAKANTTVQSNPELQADKVRKKPA
jgi:hypothetical protein